MHYLDESHISLLLVQLFVLLATAKILGAICHARGIPALAGEILAGILLGPTILGRLSPVLYHNLFPPEVIQFAMLDTVSWIGVLFLLLSTGFEVNISTVWKQSTAALSIGVVGVVVPIVVGCMVFYWLPAEYWGENANHLTFTLFLATAASITAISIVAKLLHDMNILKSDVGSASLAACAVNDVLGWVVFTMVLALIAKTGAGLWALPGVLVGIILFGAFCITIGSRSVGTLMAMINKSDLPQPGTMLSFMACLGLLCGAITDWIGIHAILGFFLAGIMAGNTSEISEHARSTLSQTIHAIFVPLFFASIGVKVDFLGGAELPVLILFTGVAIGGKFIGAWSGARMAKLSGPDALSVGIVFTPGGAMEIIIGMLALELKLITEGVFVAIVFAALLSSIAVGPLLAWSIRRRKAVDIRPLILHDAVVLELKGPDRWGVIDELCQRVAACVSDVNEADVIRAVRERETVMGTALEKSVAVPHARLDGLRQPVVAFGLSKRGVDWDPPDGLASHYVFLILTPGEDTDLQLQILASIARAMSDSELPYRLMNADNEADVFALLDKTLGIKPKS